MTVYGKPDLQYLYGTIDRTEDPMGAAQEEQARNSDIADFIRSTLDRSLWLYATDMPVGNGEGECPIDFHSDLDSPEVMVPYQSSPDFNDCYECHRIDATRVDEKHINKWLEDINSTEYMYIYILNSVGVVVADITKFLEDWKEKAQLKAHVKQMDDLSLIREYRNISCFSGNDKEWARSVIEIEILKRIKSGKSIPPLPEDDELPF